MNRHRLFRDIMPNIQDEVLRTIPHIIEIFCYSLILFFAGQCIAVSPTLQSFTTGQVTHHLEGRPDFQKYSSSNRLMENMLPTIQGPVQRRPGTRYIATVIDSDQTILVGDCIGLDYPQLQDILEDDITGLIDDIFDDIQVVDPQGVTPITNEAELLAIVRNGSYYLTTDITISGSHTPLFDQGAGNSFIGIFDGRGNKITYTITGNGLIRTGGLIGDMLAQDPLIQNCYSAMVIQGLEGTFLGGFVGEGADIGPLYTSNYWDDTIVPVLDLDDIGDEGDVAGVDKSTTTPMQQQATYIGWDFDTIWAIDEGNDYPRFIWQENSDILETPYKSGNDNVRLISFEISTDVSFIIEAGNQYFRFVKDDGT